MREIEIYWTIAIEEELAQLVECLPVESKIVVSNQTYWDDWRVRQNHCVFDSTKGLHFNQLQYMCIVQSYSDFAWITFQCPEGLSEIVNNN